MKALLLFCGLSALPFVLNSCVDLPPLPGGPGLHHDHSYDYDRPAGDFGRDTYQKGYRLGREDGRSGRSENHSRYRGEYNLRYEDSFCKGYHDGYDQGAGESHRHDRHDDDYFGGPQEWYKSGYALGKRDRHDHKSPNYRRYSNQYDRRTESRFAAGYQDGYSR